MSTKIQIDELTGLRGVAALMVMLNHVLLLYPILNDTQSFHFLNWCGIMGMNLFFILSGFVIHYNYAEKIQKNPKDGIFKFLVARFARLYPLYIVFILGYFISNFFHHLNTPNIIARDITTLPIFISGMQSWFYGIIDKFPVIYCQGNANISWSISTEFALYLFFIPLAFIGFKFKKQRSYIISFITILVLNIIWQYFVQTNTSINELFVHFFGESDIYNATSWLVYHSPIARLLQFIFGCLIAEYFVFMKNKQNMRRYKALYLIAILSLIGLISAGSYITTIYRHILSTILMMLLVLGVTMGSNKFLKSKPLIFLGEISYSSYLLHIIFVSLFKYSGTHMISYIINLPLFLICTYVLAYLVYKFYEMPMRKKVKDFLLNR